jgi:anti-anti-sigma factor
VIQPTLNVTPSAVTTHFRRKPEASVPQMAVMIFRGEYDIATAARLRADLHRLRDFRRVVLDFTDVTYLDSKTIHELVDLHHYRAEKGYEREALVFRSPTLQKIFGILNLQQVFHCVSNLSDVVPKDNTPSHLFYAKSPLDPED